MKPCSGKYWHHSWSAWVMANQYYQVKICKRVACQKMRKAAI